MANPLESMSIRGQSKSNCYGPTARMGRDGKARPHQGWDLSSPVGTDVLAVADGEIIDNFNKGDYGMQIIVKFKKGETVYYAHYAHLSSTSVKVGDKVTEGQKLGKSGMTGNAKSLKKSEAHLHFEIRTSRFVGKGMGGRVDPSDIIGSMDTCKAE